MNSHLTRLLVLLALVGCAGENQNYKINHEDTPLLREPYSAAPSSSEPSVTGLDRSHWAKQTVEPERGQFHHHPVYFTRDYRGKPFYKHKDRPSPLYREDPTSEKSLTAALARDHEERGDVVRAPLKFGYDLATMPWKVLTSDPPSASRHSPQ